MSVPTHTPEWFAPDVLIGSSLPFERRAAPVARRPLSFAAETRQSRPRPPSWPRVLPAAAAARRPVLFFSSPHFHPGLSLGFQLGERLGQDTGLVPGPNFAANSLCDLRQALS
jgi:hypothetical protein